MRRDVPLSEMTTLEVGGPARRVARASSASEVRDLFGEARRRGMPATLLGEGSNLLASDEGYDGLVVQLADASVEVGRDGVVRAAAGGSWDALVARTVEEGLAGIECLSGIPGLVGAAPIQNIGAYGQEVAETLVAVQALDLGSGEVRRLPREECGFGYRMSRFKGDWKGRYAVLGIELALRRDGAPTVRYADLRGRVGEGAALEDVRRTVLEVRRSKSMVRDPEDPNRRSAGSFFVNPVVAEEQASGIRDERPLKAWPAGPGLVKLPAAWLIEGAGFRKGHVHGRAGLSSNHVLALINRGGATAAELLDLAREIRDAVKARYGILLEPEPNFLGFRRPPLA